MARSRRRHHTNDVQASRTERIDPEQTFHRATAAQYGGLVPMQREALMNRQQFEAQLKADGYTEIEAKFLQSRPANDHHGHPYAVRGLVLTGAFTVAQNNISKTYLPGEIFSVARGCEHSEEIGPAGAEVLVGRKY